MKLEGKVAFVSGSSKGIGFSIADRLAAAGCKVVVNSRSAADVEKAVSELKGRHGVEILGLAGDVSKEDEVKSMYDQIIGKFGTVNILVNNAGITRDNLILRMKEEDWQAVLDINLKSVFLTCKVFLKSLLKNSGRIINISSVVGEIGNPGQSNYSASKGGMISFSKSLAREVASRHVTVNVVSPGYVETDMTEVLSEEIKKKLYEQIPLRRIGNASDIAEAVCFLAGDGSSYITGHVLSVNGGLSM